MERFQGLTAKFRRAKPLAAAAGEPEVAFGKLHRRH
jgi:hypothetical protein